MAKTEKKDIKIDVILPDDGYPKRMYFNRFRVHREDGFLVVHFGMDSAEGILDHFSGTISQFALEQGKLPLIDYLNRMGQPKEKPAAWNKTFAINGVAPFDGVCMANQSDVAETALFLYSLTAGLRMANETGDSNIKAQPVVLLRSTVDIQKQLIVALYEE